MKWLGLVWDLLVVAALVVVRSWAHVRGRPEQVPEALADVPEAWWQVGGVHDFVLSGPDAGAWAANVQAWIAGGALDLHRLPVWTAATASMTRMYDDVVFAGHLVNHLASGLVVVGTYLLGRATSGRGAGTLAALLVAFSPELVASKLDYGVDPVLQLALLGLGLGAWAAVVAGVPGAVLMGIAGGLAAGTHYLAAVFVVPAVVLPLLGPGKERWLGPFVYAAVAGTVWWLLLRPYPDLSLAQLVDIYVEGVAGSGGRVQNTGMDTGLALDVVLSRLHNAPELAVQRGLRGLAVDGVPWIRRVERFWLGVLGPFLRAERRWGIDVRATLTLLFFLGPLVVLEAARAPDRYALYARPFLFLCVARGVASLAGGVEHAAKLKLRGGLACALALGLAAYVAEPLMALWNLQPPVEKGLQVRAVGETVAEAFGEGEAVATSNAEVAFYAGRARCPANPCPGAGDLGACLELLDQQCGRSGDIPYVIEVRDQRGYGDQPNAALDALVAERFDEVDTWRGREARYELYRVDRSGLRMLAAEQP